MKMRGRRGVGAVVIEPGEAARVLEAYATRKAGEGPSNDTITPTVEGEPANVEVRPGFKLAKAREVKPHVSLYLHPRVIAFVKRAVATDGRKAHDFYLDALDAYLRARHGTSIAHIEREGR